MAVLLQRLTVLGWPHSPKGWPLNENLQNQLSSKWEKFKSLLKKYKAGAYPRWWTPGDATHPILPPLQFPSPTEDTSACTEGQAQIKPNACILRWLLRHKQEPPNEGSRFSQLAYYSIFIYTFILKWGNKFTLLRQASCFRPLQVSGDSLLGWDVEWSQVNKQRNQLHANKIHLRLTQNSLLCI